MVSKVPAIDTLVSIEAVSDMEGVTGTPMFQICPLPGYDWCLRTYDVVQNGDVVRRPFQIFVRKVPHGQ